MNWGCAQLNLPVTVSVATLDTLLSSSDNVVDYMKDIAQSSNFVINFKNLHLLLFQNYKAYPHDMDLDDALISVDGTEPSSHDVTSKPRHVTSVCMSSIVSGWIC